MSEINPKITRERLNQIAARKLSALGLPFQPLQPGQEGEPLTGTITFDVGRVIHPVTKLPVTRTRYEVVGHDRIRFLDPPLGALAAISFYEAKNVAELEQRVLVALNARAKRMEEVAGAFRAVRLRTTVDPDTLTVQGLLVTHEATFEFEGREDGVVLTGLIEGSQRMTLPDMPLDLSEFTTPVELEIHLSDALPSLKRAASQAEQTARAKQQGLADEGDVLEFVPPPVGVPTLGTIVHHFGPGVTLVPGNRVAISQEFALGTQRYHFHAVHEAGDTYRARLTGPTGVKWEDRVDLKRFPGTLKLVAAVLGARVREEAPTVSSTAAVLADAGLSQAASTSSVGIRSPIAPGEVWLMFVLVEAEDAEQVRYISTDVDRRPYGSPRVVKRADFEQIFTQKGGSWRLLIAIERVTGEAVFYRHLDRHRRPFGPVKSLDLPVLWSNFLPEALG